VQYEYDCVILSSVTHCHNCCYYNIIINLTTNHYKPRRTVKTLAAAAADNFSWLGGAPSVFRLAAAPNDSGWRRRRESAAEGSRQEAELA